MVVFCVVAGSRWSGRMFCHVLAGPALPADPRRAANRHGTGVVKRPTTQPLRQVAGALLGSRGQEECEFQGRCANTVVRWVSVVASQVCAAGEIHPTSSTASSRIPARSRDRGPDRRRSVMTPKIGSQCAIRLRSRWRSTRWSSTVQRGNPEALCVAFARQIAPETEVQFSATTLPGRAERACERPWRWPCPRFAARES